MLAWTERSDGWYANGYRIVCLAPYRWIVVDAAAARPTAVRVEMAPLASAKTFKGCKREAELLAAAARRADSRRKHIAGVFLSAAGVMLSLDAPLPWNVVAVATFSYLAFRSLAIMLGTLAWRRQFNGSHLYQ